MKRLILVALLALSATTLFAGEIVITPNPIASPAPAPQVCISKFKPDSFVSVMLPEFSYGFVTTDRGAYCHAPDYTLNLAPGTYDVPVMVCHYVAGATPTRCKITSSVTLVVE